MALPATGMAAAAVGLCRLFDMFSFFRGGSGSFQDKVHQGPCVIVHAVFITARIDVMAIQADTLRRI